VGHAGEEFGLVVVRRLNGADEAEWPRFFEGLRKDRRLNDAVSQMNLLLHQPQHRDETIKAFRRLGLWWDD